MKMICDQCGGKVPFEDLRNGKCPRCTAVTCIECGEPLNLQDPVTNGMCFKCAWGDPTPKPSKPPVVAQDETTATPRTWRGNDSATFIALAVMLLSMLLAGVLPLASPRPNTSAALTLALAAMTNSGVGLLIGKYLKGRPNDGMIAGALLGPFGWGFMLMVSDYRPRCPACKTVVHPEASICPACKSSL
jgi:hypothetical protein